MQRLGGRSSKKIDFRLICATNDDLEDLVRKGQFREDLYYRINVVPIFVPPLRDRDGDVPLLVDHFLSIYCASARRPLKTMQPEVLEILEDYPWPGNVRELENLVQRLVVMVSGLNITAEHLPQNLLAAQRERPGSHPDPGGRRGFRRRNGTHRNRLPDRCFAAHRREKNRGGGVAEAGCTAHEVPLPQAEALKWLTFNP